MKQETVRINALDLTSIAVAAEIWFKRQNGLGYFEKELEAATNLKKQLYAVLWDEEAELVIKESI